MLRPICDGEIFAAARPGPSTKDVDSEPFLIRPGSQGSRCQYQAPAQSAGDNIVMSTDEERIHDQVEDPVSTSSRSLESGLHAIFDEIDSDVSGKLDEPELKTRAVVPRATAGTSQAALRKLGLPHDSTEYVQNLLQQYDANHDGLIDFEEFKRYVRRKEQVVSRAFKSIDVDGNGSISIEELARALHRLWVSVNMDDSHRMVVMLDRDHSTDISYEEFRRFAYLLPEDQLTRDKILYAWVDSADWMEGIEFRLGVMPPRQPFHRFIAGGVAGIMSRASVAPFERMRTIIMATSGNRSMKGAAQAMWQDGGILGLFRGNCATMAKVIPQTAIQFAVYDTIQDIMKASLQTVEHDTGLDRELPHLSKWQNLVAGCMAGAAGTLITYPLETMRTHMAMGSPTYRDVWRDILSRHGHMGLYKGFRAGLVSNTLANGIGFTTYEAGLHAFRSTFNSRPRAHERAVLAGGSAIVVMGATMPFEVVMRRMQLQGREGFPTQYANGWQCCKAILRDEGFMSFWRGCGASFMKVAPSIAMVRFSYEILLQSMGVGGMEVYRHAGKSDTALP